ncbi:hypothetical protein ILUMI_02636 [Ignelater luminosus]|uniref:Ankyrin repeat domain-containing protein 39 n=1 Tax=Ignelater luminosus TaxID=2038154 RepID=A0A8K0DCE8_IGNLU|nr:hypothetical protein ILUMI_02636 [Ignelater luminosus]
MSNYQHLHDHHNHVCQAQSTTSSLYQTLDELDFERGIWYAAQCGDTKKVEKLLSQGTNVDQRDSAGYTALHYAARNGHLDVCKVLLRNGADINSTTKSGRATALHRACSADKVHMVKFLLENKANGKIRDSDGKTALHRAAESQNKEICKSVLSAFPELKIEVDNKLKVPVDYVQTEDLLTLFD